jgi:hypothetical protein
MEEGQVGGDAGFQEAVHETIVKIQALVIHITNPLGKDTGPSDRKSVAVDAQRSQKTDVFLQVMKMVAGNFSAGVIALGFYPITKVIPDGWAATIPPIAFNLIG